MRACSTTPNRSTSQRTGSPRGDLTSNAWTGGCPWPCSAWAWAWPAACSVWVAGSSWSRCSWACFTCLSTRPTRRRWRRSSRSRRSGPRPSQPRERSTSRSPERSLQEALSARRCGDRGRGPVGLDGGRWRGPHGSPARGGRRREPAPRRGDVAAGHRLDGDRGRHRPSPQRLRSHDRGPAVGRPAVSSGRGSAPGSRSRSTRRFSRRVSPSSCCGSGCASSTARSKPGAPSPGIRRTRRRAVSPPTSPSPTARRDRRTDAAGAWPRPCPAEA